MNIVPSHSANERSIFGQSNGLLILGRLCYRTAQSDQYAKPQNPDVLGDWRHSLIDCGPARPDKLSVQKRPVVATLRANRPADRRIDLEGRAQARRPVARRTGTRSTIPREPYRRSRSRKSSPG